MVSSSISKVVILKIAKPLHHSEDRVDLAMTNIVSNMFNNYSQVSIIARSTPPRFDAKAWLPFKMRREL
jgi:hypothetical protein